MQPERGPRVGCCEDNAWLGWNVVMQDWLTLPDFRVDRTKFECEDRLMHAARSHLT